MCSIKHLLPKAFTLASSESVANEIAYHVRTAVSPTTVQFLINKNAICIYTKHIFRDGNFHNVTSELAGRVLCINARCALKYLYTNNLNEAM